MAKFNIVELKIYNGSLTDLDQKSDAEKKALQSQNAIYIYRDKKAKNIYIGQTIHFLKRHKQHYSVNNETFCTANFNQVIVIFSKYFNISVVEDVKNQLIMYFLADNQNNSLKMVEYDNTLLNKTTGNNVNDYKGREKIASEIIIPLWKEILYPNGLVTSKTPKLLKEKELVKYSPFKILTDEQKCLIDEITANTNKNYVINGDAGTGKTVLLTHLVAKFATKYPCAKIGVVVQPNWEKIGISIFKTYGILNNNLSILSSTKLIKTNEKYDIIIVDEAHKLSRKYGKQQPSFNSVYKINEFSNCTSHLEIIQHLGKQIILMYDVLQAIRPANIRRDTFQSLTANYEKRFLSTQFRIQTPNDKNYTSDDYINGIKYLLYKDTGLLDSQLTNYNPNFNRELFRDTSPDAYFGYVTDHPLHQLTDWLEKDINFNPQHINRVLAGLVEDWKQSDGENPNITHWHEGDLNLRWNSKQENWINSTDKDAEKQIGSVFAVQGIDLNKVGVLIGNDLQVNSNGKLFANPENFFNTNGTFTKQEMTIKENQFEFTLFVMNIYYVLLTRGIDGVRIGFWKNDSFRKYMEKTLSIK